MSKSIYYLTSLLLAALLIVVILVYTADVPNKEKNGFNRQYITGALTPLSTLSTNGDITGICGATSMHFYFSTSDPEKLVSTDHALQEKKYIPLHIDPAVKDSMDLFFFTAVDSPAVYIYAYNLPAVLTASLQTDTVKKLRLPPGGYSQAVAFSGNGFVFRKLDLQLADQFFVRLNGSANTLAREEQLSESYRDGGMSTDGMLNYDKRTGLFTYLYHYSNRYFQFDSSLRRVNTGHTIDTFSRFRFALSGNTAAEKHVFTNGGPDKIVNQASAMDSGLLFVHSLLKADNESDEQFNGNKVIDVYNLQQGRYLGSFYLPVKDRERLSKLSVYGNVLLALCRNRLYAWRINPQALLVSQH